MLGGKKKRWWKVDGKGKEGREVRRGGQEREWGKVKTGAERERARREGERLGVRGGRRRKGEG